MSLDRFTNCDTFHGCCLVSVVYLGANLAGFIERLAVAPLQAEILSHLSWTQAVNTLQKVYLTDHFISYSGCKLCLSSNKGKVLLIRWYDFTCFMCSVSSLMKTTRWMIQLSETFHLTQEICEQIGNKWHLTYSFLLVFPLQFCSFQVIKTILFRTPWQFHILCISLSPLFFQSNVQNQDSTF